MNADVLLVPAVAVCLASLVAGFTDVWRFKVYNHLTFPVAALALLYHGWQGGGGGALYSLAGFGLGLVVLLLPYSFGMLGAGDVKFTAAIGAWLGAEHMLTVLLLGALVTGVFSLIIIVRRAGFRGVLLDLKLLSLRMIMIGQGLLAEDVFESVQDAAHRPERRHRMVPFSAMIAVAVILMLAYQFLTVAKG